MNIWIDLANSPHVNFFLPIIRYLNSKNHHLIITCREYSETSELVGQFNIDAKILGKHGGKNILNKIFTTIKRVYLLYRYVKDKNIDIAVSHNSYSQIIAGKFMKTKIITIMDYEGQPANHLAFRLADRVIVPNSFPDRMLKKFGAHNGNIIKYNGFKEQVYLSDFEEDMYFLKNIYLFSAIDKNINLYEKVIITLRPPATMALYHRFKNKLFDKLLLLLNNRNDIIVFVLPRSLQQRFQINENYPDFIIPKRAIDGRNMIYFSDIVISAGGTMNRESAVLGTPTYTIFAGKIPAVDMKLVEMKRMHILKEESDFKKIEFKKKNRSLNLVNKELMNEIVNNILF